MTKILLGLIVTFTIASTASACDVFKNNIFFAQINGNYIYSMQGSYDGYTNGNSVYDSRTSQLVGTIVGVDLYAKGLVAIASMNNLTVVNAAGISTGYNGDWSCTPDQVGAVYLLYNVH
jgi:hypothetical protein